MKNLWNNLNSIENSLKLHKTKILISDFDGTLTPIINTPQMVKLQPRLRNILRKLILKRNFYLAIISGRELSDIKAKINLPNIIYGGNHGLEGEMFGEKFFFPIGKKTLLIFKKIKEQFNKIAGQFKGVFIEDKTLTLSFHYRSANKQSVPKIIPLISKVLGPFIRKGLISTLKGKMVIDVIPKVNWNKGLFARLIINKISARTKTNPAVIFIGDDSTDKTVFRALKNDITISVGKHGSFAKYYLKNTAQTADFLKHLM